MPDSRPYPSLIHAFRLPWYAAVPTLAVIVALAVFPQIDLAVSGAFYDAARGGFYFSQYPVMRIFDSITSFASGLFLLACLGWWLVVQRKRDVRLRISDRLMAYFMLVFLIGPVLVVSLGFKEHWGRMRPVEVTAFGGEEPFLPYYLPDGICEDDCSFPSGHASRGFYFMAVAIAAYGFGWAYRRAILLGAVAFGLFSASLRILEGKHFLSDVTLSAILVSYLAWVLFRLLFYTAAGQALPQDASGKT